MEPRVGWDQFLVSLFDPTAFDGMGLLFSKKAQKALNPQIQVLESRLIVVDITANGVLTTLVNLYAPVGPKENATFFRKLTGRHWHRATPHVVAGDFNVTVNPLLDRPGQRTRINRRIDTTDFEAFVNRLALEDIWRARNPSSTAITRKGQLGASGSRIDRFYVPLALFETVTGPKHKVTPFSDHDAVLLDLYGEFNVTTDPQRDRPGQAITP